MRRCKTFIDGAQHEVLFHQFGTRMRYGSDNEPQQETIAIVEMKDGKVKEIEPNKVQFIDPPE